MKLKFIAILSILVLAVSAFAEEKPSARQRTFGIGVIIGEPTGFTAKYMLDRRIGIDAGVGWKTSGDNEFHIYGDGLYHLHDIIKIPKGEMPIYCGAGLRYVNRDKKDDEFGVRIPVGVEYFFDMLPLGAFAELVPVINLSPDTDLDLEGGIGVRFYF